MKWEVFIPPERADAMQTTVTVDADNWLKALNSGLKQLGEQGEVTANVMCDVRDDGSIHVTDFRSRRTFTLVNLDKAEAMAAVPEGDGTSFLESRASVVPADQPEPPPTQEAAPASAQEPVQEGFMESDAPPTPAALPEHEVFFTRDDNPQGDSNLVYRERLIAATGLGRDEVEGLLENYFETLRRQAMAIEGAHYINIAIYPQSFKGRPPGPPTGALSWQDWKDQQPHITFPAQEPARVETSYIPPEPESAPEPEQVPPAPAPAQEPAPAAADASVSQPSVERTVKERAGRARTVPAEEGMKPVQSPPEEQPPESAPTEPPPEPKPQEQERRRSPSQEMKIGREPESMDTGEILAEVFEEMQDLFMTETQDDAADFALELSMRKIPAEAGSVFLADINTRELYFAAVRGPTADKLKGQRLHMTKGIVGFAARRGAAIAISDVRKDPRFCNEFDQDSGFVTKSVVCAPIQYEGRSYGAVEILNRAAGDSFTQGEVNVISYIASQLAEYIATSLPTAEPDLEEETKGRPVPKAGPGPRKKKGKTKARGRRK